MAIDQHTAAQIYVRLANLESRLATHRDVRATLHDNRLTVTGPDGRKEYITCARRQDDGGNLWFYDLDRRPVEQADRLTDAAMRIAARVREPADV